MYGSRALLLQSGDPSRNGASTLLHPDPGFGNATSILTSVTMPCTVKSSAQGYSLSSEIRKKDGKCLDLEIEIMTYELRPPLLGLQKKYGKCLDLVIEIMRTLPPKHELIWDSLNLILMLEQTQVLPKSVIFEA